MADWEDRIESTARWAGQEYGCWAYRVIFGAKWEARRRTQQGGLKLMKKDDEYFTYKPIADRELLGVLLEAQRYVEEECRAVGKINWTPPAQVGSEPNS